MTQQLVDIDGTELIDIDSNWQPLTTQQLLDIDGTQLVDIDVTLSILTTVSFETSFDSKQLESKLVLAKLFPFYIETNRNYRNKPKQSEKFAFGFIKQTSNQQTQIEFWFLRFRQKIFCVVSRTP